MTEVIRRIVTFC